MSPKFRKTFLPGILNRVKEISISSQQAALCTLIGISSCGRMLSCGRCLVMPNSSQPELPLEYIPLEVFSLCGSIIILLFVQWYHRYWALIKIPLFLLRYQKLYDRSISFVRWNFLMHLCSILHSPLLILHLKSFSFLWKCIPQIFTVWLPCVRH